MESSAFTPDGDISRLSVVLIPMIGTAMIATILTIMRIYVRLWVVKMPGWDDLFNVLAAVTVLVVMGLLIEASLYGLGRHIQYLEHASAAYSVKLLRISEFLLILSTIFLKISISLFLRRIFVTSKRWRGFLWAFIAFNTTTSLLDAVVIFPQCTPVQLSWDHSVEGHCWSKSAINAIGIVQGSIAAITDFILAFLPIVFLWNVRIATKIKLGICGLMALGFASGGFAIARTRLVPSLTVTHDPTWDLVHLYLWASLEATFGVIAAAVPGVRPLFNRKSRPTPKSRRRSYLVPLQSVRTDFTSSHPWYPGGGSTINDMQSLKDYVIAGGAQDAQRMSDSESSQVGPCIDQRGAILKTTNVLVQHSEAV